MLQQPPLSLDEFEWFLGVFKIIGTGRDRQENDARDALRKLCQQGQNKRKGFDANVLAYYFGFFRHLVERKKLAEPSEGRVEYPTQRDLEQISGRAEKLLNDVQKLKKTPTVCDLWWTARFPGWNLSGEPLAVTEACLNTLIELPSLLRDSTPRMTKPTTIEDRLWILCGYVKATTGFWNDELLASILAPLDIPYCHSGEALKEWRYRYRRSSRHARRET